MRTIASCCIHRLNPPRTRVTAPPRIDLEEADGAVGRVVSDRWSNLDSLGARCGRAPRAGGRQLRVSAGAVERALPAPPGRPCRLGVRGMAQDPDSAP